MNAVDQALVDFAQEALSEYESRAGLTDIPGTWDTRQAAKLSVHVENLLNVIARMDAE